MGDAGASTSPASLDVDVIIIGAGFSGIATLYRVRKLGLKPLILESADDFGGVWKHNSYPGARVDSEWPYYQLNIPEVYRTFSFTERFPGHVELKRYMAHIDKVLGLRKDVLFNAHVNDCSWDEGSGRWTVKTRQGQVATGKYLILCTGLLHRRHYPEFPGLENFKGVVHHSGFWPEDLSTKGKKVALIGAGATAVQITQEVAKDADQLTIFMRRPSYCLPMMQRSLTELENRGFQAYYDTLLREGRNSQAGFPGPRSSRSALEGTPEEREAYMEDLWSRGGFQFLMAFADVTINEEANKVMYTFWQKKVAERMRSGKKRDLMAPPLEKMPYFIGTKRCPLEQDYYECVDQDNVDVVDMNEKKLKSFTDKGIVFEDGTETEFDLLILATGFDSFSGSITNLGLKNKDGIDIKDIWKEGIKSYLGMSFGGFPNCFMIYSPHAPTALSNGPTIIEAQADMIRDFISNLEAANVKSITPQGEAQEEWVEMVDKLNSYTLFPLTSSWWTGGNVPGKKVQLLTYILGIDRYEAQCREKLDELKGFDVVYADSKEKLVTDMPKAAVAS
ncbi:hypothetical protein LTR05_001545 [Lithohypha guttulata]|uniref:Flavin-containing monooxygenase n=1 Tax=Lithohypha guttulata TaxID=1690604 RepID=A0AAN7YAE9_9EURO|nr:hypothetical protein LTR05_001545 [Lithohypha guttulata]